MSERIRIGDQWYVAATAARAEESPHVIKREDTFALFDRFGDIRTWGMGEQGLYHEDTRFLSHLELTVNGVRPMYLGSTVKESSNLLISELMNPDLLVDGKVDIVKGDIQIFRAKLLWEGACYEHIRLSHYGLEPVRLDIGLRFEADFVDLFEVRGSARAQRGECLPAETQRDELVFGYRGLDGRDRATRIRLSPEPTHWSEHEAHFVVDLQPHQEAHIYCTIACDIGTPRTRERSYDDAYQANSAARAKQQSA